MVSVSRTHEIGDIVSEPNNKFANSTGNRNKNKYSFSEDKSIKKLKNRMGVSKVADEAIYYGRAKLVTTHVLNKIRG